VASKPKAADYKPSEAEKASASVAMAEYQYFKEKYDPLLQEMRDKSLTEDVQSGLRGRANADVMQALSAPSYEAATSSTVAKRSGEPSSEHYAIWCAWYRSRPGS